MNRPVRIILSLLLSSAFLVLLNTTRVEANCNQTRFTIEDEVTGQNLGLIFTDSSTRRGEGKDVCLEGTFAGVKYQYLYRCVNDRYKFIRKFHTTQKGCKWGEIH